jgi:hypothetical protein
MNDILKALGEYFSRQEQRLMDLEAKVSELNADKAGLPIPIISEPTSEQIAGPNSFSVQFSWATQGFSKRSLNTVKQSLNSLKTGRACNANPKYAGWVRASDVTRALGYELGTSKYITVNGVLKRLLKNGALEQHPDNKLYRLSERAELSYDQCQELWDLDRVSQPTRGFNITTSSAAQSTPSASASEGDAEQEQGEQASLPRESTQLVLALGNQPI